MTASADILVVEDESIVAVDLRQTLEEAGYNVLDIIDRGRDVVEAVRDLEPDLILMDIKLKDDKSGIQAARELSITDGPPIIYLTAHTGEKTLEKARQTDPYAYLKKPFDPEELKSNIEMVLNKHREVQQEKKEFLQELHLSREEYHNLVATIPAVVFQLDKNGRFAFISRDIPRGFNDPEALIGKDLKTIIHPADHEKLHEANIYEPGPAGSEDALQDHVASRKNTSYITNHLEVHLNPDLQNQADRLPVDICPIYELTYSRIFKHGEDQKPPELIRTVGVMRDVTRQKNQNQALRQTQEIFKHVMENIQEVFFLIDLDPKMNLESVFGANEYVFGKSVEQLKGDIQTWLHTIHPGDRKTVENILGSTDWYNTGETISVRYRLENGNGSNPWIETRFAPIGIGELSSQHIAAVSQDISEQKKKEDTIEELAYYDQLTQLPDRSYFLDALNNYLDTKNEDEEGAVLFVDIEGLQNINDALGYRLGDEVLKQISKDLKQALGNQYTVSRWGGAEFTVLMKNISGKEEIEEVVQFLFSGLTSPYAVEDSRFYIHLHIGVGRFEQEDVSAEDVIERADIAMGETPDAERNSVRYYEDVGGAHLKKRKRRIKSLRRAVDSEEITVYYQPVLSTEREQLTEVEALVRWQHPRKGILQAADFIRLSEETGIVVEMGKYMLKRAFTTMEDWMINSGDTPDLAVNISYRELLREDYMNYFHGLMEESPFPSEKIHVDISETALMENKEQLKSELQTLSDRGVFITLDDFGSGFTSLENLAEFPIDNIKIDRRFIAKTLDQKKHMAIIKSIRELAKDLSLDVVHKGIDSKELKEALSEYCDRMQGFYFSRPLPPSELRRRYEDGNIP